MLERQLRSAGVAHVLTVLILAGCALQALVVGVLQPPQTNMGWTLLLGVCAVAMLAGVFLVRHSVRALGDFTMDLREGVAADDWQQSLRPMAAGRELQRDVEALRRGFAASLAASQDLRREAEEASRYKTEFLESVRHELRTPLNSILGFSDVLLSDIDGPLGESQRENLRVIHRSGTRLLALFNDVIDLSAAVAGQLELDATSVDPAALIADVVKALEVVRANKPVHIRGDVAESTPALSGHAERLRQVLVGLGGHALSTLSSGELVLGAALRGDRVRLTVRDNGAGMDAEALSRLLDRGAGPGKGEAARLRLAICRELVERQHGSLVVESQPGQGTAIIVELPIWVSR